MQRRPIEVPNMTSRREDNRLMAGTWFYDSAPARRAVQRYASMIQVYSTELANGCRPQRAEELMLLLSKGIRLQRRAMALAASRQWRVGIERAVEVPQVGPQLSPGNGLTAYMRPPASGDERRERTRLRELRKARRGQDEPVLRQPSQPVPQTATKFKGAKKLGTMLSEALALEAILDPIDIEARRRGLTREDYVEGHKARRRIAQDVERRAEREGRLIMTPDRVWNRLVCAWEVVFRMPVERGPRGFGNNWPEYVTQFEDMVGRDDSEVKSARWYLRKQGPPSEDEMRSMVQAIEWPKLIADRGTGKVVELAALWEATGANRRDKIRLFGMAKTKFYELKKDGLAEISHKLKPDGAINVSGDRHNQ